MGSKKTVNETHNNTQTAAPPSWTMPGIQNAADRVTAALNTLPGESYSGPFVAQLDPQMNQNIMDAYGGAAGRAGTFGDMITTSMADLGRPADYGGAQVAAPNAYNGFGDGETRLNAAITAAMDPAFKQLNQQVLPSIKSSALESGAYSGDRAMSVVPQQAIDQATASAQRIGADLGYQGFQADENRKLSAWDSNESRLLQAFGLNTQRGTDSANIDTQRLGMIPQFANSAMGMYASQGDLLSRVLQQQLAGDQASIDNNLMKDDYNYKLPFRGLDIATNLLSQLSGNYGTRTDSGTSQQVEKSGGGLGGILQGAMGLASMVGGATGMGGPLAGLFGGGGAATTAISSPAASMFSQPWSNPALNPNGLVTGH